jgi:deazaflavin-dependent oxidoreductase (nitroreductase family)
LARALNQLTALIFAAGVWPQRVARLEVVGRRSGRPITFPVVIADYEGAHYLVAMLGEEANWVRNLRAAGGRAVLRRGRRQDVFLEEVPVAGRAVILRRYLAVAPGARAHFAVDRDAPLEEFERIAPTVPVFAIRMAAGHAHDGATTPGGTLREP